MFGMKDKTTALPILTAQEESECREEAIETPYVEYIGGCQTAQGRIIVALRHANEGRQVRLLLPPNAAHCDMSPKEARQLCSWVGAAAARGER